MRYGCFPSQIFPPDRWLSWREISGKIAEVRIPKMIAMSHAHQADAFTAKSTISDTTTTMMSQISPNVKDGDFPLCVAARYATVISFPFLALPYLGTFLVRHPEMPVSTVIREGDGGLRVPGRIIRRHPRVSEIVNLPIAFVGTAVAVAVDSVLPAGGLRHRDLRCQERRRR